jgi:hypothetical protein
MRDWRIAAGVASAIGVAIGLGLVALFGGTTREDSNASPGELAQTSSKASGDPQHASGHESLEWAALQADLARESQARTVLSEEIEMLWEELERLNERLELASAVASSQDPGNQADPAPSPHNAKRWFDDTRLAGQGIAPDEIERLRELFEAAELDELYLYDQAAREGWLRSSRYRQEAKDLSGHLREDLGEEDYDRMLFATGQNNRVRVKDVFGKSPAADAGVIAGDIILRYADQRIFTPRALRSLTTQGALSKSVSIEILRNGEIIFFSLPRGPLGTRIAGESSAPL